MSTHDKKHIQINNKREFVTAEEGEIYAIIKGAKGDKRFDIEIIRTGEITFAKARGALKKGKDSRIQNGDIVLVQEGEPMYILHKYLEHEVKKLTKMGELVSFKPKNEDLSGILFEDDVKNQEADEVGIDINDI